MEIHCGLGWLNMVPDNVVSRLPDFPLELPMHWWEQAKPIFAHRGYSATGMRDHWLSFLVPARLKLNQTALYLKVHGQMQRNL